MSLSPPSEFHKIHLQSSGAAFEYTLPCGFEYLELRVSSLSGDLFDAIDFMATDLLHGWYIDHAARFRLALLQRKGLPGSEDARKAEERNGRAFMIPRSLSM